MGDGSGTNLRRLPPEQRRFRKPNGKYKKYHSGNPDGRPREFINLRTALVALLQEQDPTAGNGRVMSKKEALMHTLFNQAARGNQRAFAKFFMLAKRAGYLDPPAPAQDRSEPAVFGDIEKFKAEFGKPLPESAEP
jgi:hypothetical protein